MEIFKIKSSILSSNIIFSLHLILCKIFFRYLFDSGFNLMIVTLDWMLSIIFCVFSGKKGFYSEVDSPAPIDIYGRSKLHGEKNNEN